MTFETTNSFIKWWKENESEKFVFLCEYNLSDPVLNGADLIESLATQGHNFLITDLYHDESLEKACMRNDLKIIPRQCIKFLDIHRT